MHHASHNFKDEYMKIMSDEGIEFNNAFLSEFYL